jgi:malate/lactate dehydrogenase
VRCGPSRTRSALLSFSGSFCVAGIALDGWCCAGKPAASLRNVVVWGNHSDKQVPDVRFAMVEEGGSVTPVGSLVSSEWISDELVPAVRTRGKAVIEARGGLSSGASAAYGICDHIQDWLFGSDGRVISMAVISDGNPFGVADGLVFSFPVITSPGGKWTFAEGFPLDAPTLAAVRLSETELLEEREAALPSN